MDSVPSWKSYSKRQKETLWRTWLHTPVFLDVLDPNSSLKRYECFLIFCKKGLIPFVESHGYVFHRPEDLANQLANFLYKKTPGDFVAQSFKREQSTKLPYDLDYDNYTQRGIPQEDWDAFWRSWNRMSDFTDENFRNQFLIPVFVYNRLNLEYCEATKLLTEELEEMMDGDDNQGQTYAQENASDPIGTGKDRHSLY